MINLRDRSAQKELLDAEGIPFDDIRQNMKELNAVNTKLGGHNISISAVKSIIKSNRLNNVSICEIGCGGGDNLAAIYKWCRANKIAATFIGIDIKKECIDYAKSQYPEIPVTWMVNDFRAVRFIGKPSIIFSSLFCHHFNNDEIIEMLQWMGRNSATGFFINDLHRHQLAYHLIKKLTGLFSRSYLVRNDAPLSVARGFKKHEWEWLLQKAGITNYTISWRWAFRYLIICDKYGSKNV